MSLVLVLRSLWGLGGPFGSLVGSNVLVSGFLTELRGERGREDRKSLRPRAKKNAITTTAQPMPVLIIISSRRSLF